MLTHALFGAVTAMSALARRHRCFFDFSCIALWVFAALRYGFGNDYFSYYQSFLEIRMMGENPFPREPLYTALNHMLPHYYWLVAFSSLLFAAALWLLIRRNVSAEWLWLSVGVLLLNPYLFLTYLSAIRQSLALVCFLAALPYARRGRPVPYCLLVLLACGFHNSAVILFPVYFWANSMPVSRAQTVAIAAGTAALLALGHLLRQPLAAGLSLMRLEQYQHVLADGLNNSLRATLLSSVTFVYLLWNLPRLRGKTLIFAKLWLIGGTLSVLAYRMSMLTRLEMYFDLFAIAAFPRMLAGSRREHPLADLANRWIFPVLLVIIWLLRYYSFFQNPMWESFLTYQSILGT